jgi:outer membrane immunogenic protein
LNKSGLVFSLFAAVALSFVPAHADERQPWNGLYVGLHGGYAWQGTSGVFDSNGDATSLALSLNGAIVGGQLGYNLQYGWFMLGFEADGSANTERGSVVNDATLLTSEQLNSDVGYLVTLRGRMGVAFDSILVYGTAGVAFARFKFTEDAPSAPFHGALRLDNTGLVYGGGLEWALAYGVTVRGEYLHYNVGKSTAIPASFSDADPGDFVRFNDIDVARAGINISLSP